MIMVIIMAKRKKSKESNNPGMSVELTGLILALIGIIGFGFGYIGTIIKEFAMFLLGSWWIVFVIYLLLVGLYMLFKRKMPKFFSSRLIGFYLIMIVILVASHFTFLDKSGSPAEILKITFDQFMERINTIDISNSILNTGNTSIAIGGGLIGAAFISGLYFLFAKAGTIVVLVVIGIFGLIMLFDITLTDVIDKLRSFVRKSRDEKSNSDDNDSIPKLSDISEEVVEEIKSVPSKDNKIVITSLEDIKNKKIKQVVEVEPIVLEERCENKGVYTLPPLSILNELKNNKKSNSDAFTLNNKDILERVLKDFQISAKVVEIHIGPAVTQYEIVVPAGTKVSRILSINKEIALALAAKDVRIQAPIPGKSTIGIEIPNESISAVAFREILEANKNVKDKYGIMITLGKNLMGKPIVADMTKMPHLLVAGSTGSGKSVCINSIICYWIWYCIGYF